MLHTARDYDTAALVSSYELGMQEKGFPFI